MNEITSIQATDPAAHNVEAEQQLLGALLLDAGRLDQIADTRDLFYDPIHAALFAEIRARHLKGHLVSPVALKPWAEGQGGLKELGGPSYLARLAGASISGFAVQDYADMLADLREKRALQSAMKSATAAITEGSESAADIASRLEAAIQPATDAKGGGPVSIMKAVTGAIEEANAAYQGSDDTAIHTGIHGLDDLLGGMHKGDLVLLAGRPSMGKSAVGLQMALNVARQGMGVVIASLEMTPEAQAHRAISEETARQGQGVPYFDVRRGQMTEAQFRSVVDAARVVVDLPVHFLPIEYRDTGALFAGAKRAKSLLGETVGLRLLVVDYLQLLRAEGRSRYEQITEISIALKSLAQRLRVPVLALSQLSREVERREDKRPTLADIRESGQLEQDADAVIFCYRDEYYLEREKPNAEGDKLLAWHDALERSRNRLDLIVAKNRGGRIGTATAKMNPATNVIWEDQK